jgi:uncharacterized OsmC-like protein
MPHLTVTHLGSHRFEVKVDGHRLMLDDRTGGRDAIPAPNELLASSLASCAAAHAESYLATHGYSTSDLAVACHYRLTTDHPTQVAAIAVTVTTSIDLSDGRRLGLLRAVEQCMVGNTLRMPPTINIKIDPPDNSTGI